MIPDILMQEIFLMIPIDEISKIIQVCITWKELATSDVIWKVFILILFSLFCFFFLILLSLFNN